jgi:hypothetical protein
MAIVFSSHGRPCFCRCAAHACVLAAFLKTCVCRCGVCAVAWQEDSGFFDLNVVDPIGDAGSLSRLFEPSSLLPLLVVLAVLVVFFVSWGLATRLDSAGQRERTFFVGRRRRGRALSFLVSTHAAVQ